MATLTESSARLLLLYFAQISLALVLFFIFRHFGRLYRRRFLYTWALSWLAFSLYMASTGLIAVFFINSQSVARMGLSIVAQLSCFLQVIMILRGTYELVTEKAFNKKNFKIVVLIFLIIALVSVFAFTHDLSLGNYRHLVRMGTRTFATGLGFMVTGIVVWTNKKFTRGFGQRLLAASFILFSFYQLYYFVVVVLTACGASIEPVDFFGIADIFLIAIMGMSMVIWLLEDEREKLDKANKELDRFLYSTSHDLRAPIASILGLTYLGKIEFQEEKARMFMDMIEERIKKLDLVISDILSLSRTKKLDLKIEQLNLGELLDDVIVDIKFNKGASAISLDYKPDSSHVFMSDYNQMKVILSNLLANAVKYHNIYQLNAFIRVLFKRHEDYVEISIEDNGQGISEESLPKVFEMFYRASLNTEGTGLGLYIVSEALNKIKGSITVDSKLGKGSIFTIFLENA